MRSAIFLLLCLLGSVTSSASADCSADTSAVFGAGALSVRVLSSQDLSHVVLFFCDGSPSVRFDNLSGYALNFSGGGKTISGVLIKSGCTAKRHDNDCDAPAPKCTPSATPTSTPTVCPTEPPLTKLCHVPSGSPREAVAIWVKQSEVEDHLLHGDVLGSCPVDCAGVPFGGATVDLCGRCGGDNSTCKDCAGTPNGQKQIDECGVCGGDNSSCKDCDGVPNGGRIIDACGMCGGDSSTCKDCNGVPNGGAVVDLCGVCNGNNDTCVDCLGKPNGKARTDACGVCAGEVTDPGLCKKDVCPGEIDKCGVCNGSNACLDCAGIPNGGTRTDCCGVCGGDGNSCLDKCKIYKVGSKKKVALRSLNELYKSVAKYTASEKKCSLKRRAATVRRLVSAKHLLESSKKLLSFVTDTIKICDTPFCTKTNLASVLNTVQVNARKLYKMSRESQYGALRYCRQTRQGKTARNAQAFLNSAKGSLKQVPSIRCD